MRKEYQLELDGYSNYFCKKVQEKEIENYTITFSCVPYTYETNISGILSAFLYEEKKGIIIGVKKKGIVTIQIGIGTMIVELNSLKEHLQFQKSNVITCAFWGSAGWCDLYVNGILSNRKQFPRHSKTMIPTCDCYVGKYVDGKLFLGDTRCGVFHGKLDYMEFTKEYISSEKIIAYHAKYSKKDMEIELYKTQDFSNDIYRPVYHLIPTGKWMNEPHAPFWYRGFYHIFYQSNPHAPIWDNLCWGHLVSNDMINWKDAGIALYPDEENVDIDGCWSGSACLNDKGIPMLFYTAGNNNDMPNQSIAMAVPQNTEDEMLKVWEKKGVVLRQTLGEGFLGEFRDPFVWKRGELYYILVGTGDAQNGGGNALLYTTKDLRKFECHGFVVDYNYDTCKEIGHVWELPILLPLKNEWGVYCCDILMLCACQVEGERVEVYYFLGKFDYDDNKFKKYHDKPQLIDLGNGTFTGPSGFVTPDGRSVVFTIAQGKRAANEEYWSGWAHNGGMPVELSMQKNSLKVEPIVEVQKYFSRHLLLEEVRAKGLEDATLHYTNLLENRILVTTVGDYIELCMEWEEDAYVVSYNRITKEWKAISKQSGSMISKIRDEQDLVDIEKEEIKIECFVDHSLLEFYINGRKSLSLRSYAFCRGNSFWIKADQEYKVSIWKYERIT